MTIVRWTPENVTRPVEAGFKPAADGVTKIAQNTAPRKTGRLAAGTQFTTTGKTSGYLGVQGVPYSAPVIKGAVEHAIKPKNAEALKVPVLEGFVTFVRHPGNKPNPYLQKAARSFQPLYVNSVRGFMHLGF
jgi:hypothetical protein